MQDNNEESGGGLEIISGSHKNPHINRKDPSNSENYIIEKGDISKSKAGDLVLWDSRVVHRSIKNNNPKLKKLALQWTISNTNRFASKYLNYLSNRSYKQTKHVSDMGTDREDAFLKEAISMNIEKIPRKLLNKADKNNITINFCEH